MAAKLRIDINLHTAEDADLPALMAFIQPFIDDGKVLPRDRVELESLLGHIFIVEYNGELVGCAMLEIHSKKLAELRTLCVSPSVQGMGVGRMLVNACLELAHQENVLEVMAITANDAFFLACGFDFTMTGEKKALFYQTRES